jgi:cytochrome c551/c552
MSRARTPLALALMFAALFLLAFAGTTAAGFGISFRYAGAPGFVIARTAGLAAAGLAGLAVLAAAAVVGVAAALRPAGRWRKLLYVLPAYLLGFTLVGALLAALRIGTTGNFTVAWIAVGVLASIVATIVALLRLPLGERALRRALLALRAAGWLSALAWLGVLATIAIVLTSAPRPAAGGFGGESGFDQGPPGQGQRGGSTTPLLIGGALLTLFGALELIAIRRAGRAAAEGAAAEAPAPAGVGREAGQAVFSAAAITIVALAAAQLVPIKHDNPPAQTAIKWDSAQTEGLAKRACMDCHSNETVWPWYTYVAPSSWLTRNHVAGGREELNFSELNNIRSFRLARLPNDVAQQIRNGSMPPADYLLLHPDARLSDAEKQQLIQGLQASLAASLPR